MPDVSANSKIIFFILIFAFFVRAIGIQFGLPSLFHADEPIVVNHAMAYGSGDLNPHFFKIPPLVSYLLFIVYGFFYLVGLLFRWFRQTEDFILLFLNDPSIFYLIARIVFGAFLGTATVFALYRVVKKNFSQALALASAFLFAVNFLHVRDSHYIYADIPLVFILVISFEAIFRILKRGNLNDYLFFGALAGIATATKYNGVFIWISALTAHFLMQGVSFRSLSERKLWLAAGMTIALFFLLNPFGLLDFRFFLNELHSQSSAESVIGFTHHLTYSLGEGIGVVILILFFLESTVIFSAKDLKGYVLLSFILVYYAVLTQFSQPYDRYVLPLIPFMIILAAKSVLRIAQRFKWRYGITAGFIFLIALPSLVKIYHLARIFLAEDTRTIAKVWVESNIPAGEKLALGEPFFMPRLKPSAGQLREKGKMVTEAHAAQKKRMKLMIEDAARDQLGRYELYFLKDNGGEGDFLFSKPNLPYDFHKLKAQNVRYVLISKQGIEKREPFYADLKQQGKLLARFTPFKDLARETPIDQKPLTGGPFLWADLIGRNRNGQIIEVYQL